MITTMALTSFLSQQTIDFANPEELNAQPGMIKTLDSQQWRKLEAMKAAPGVPMNSAEQGGVEVYKLK